MKKIITIYRQPRYQVEPQLEEAIKEILEALPDYINDETVIIIEVHTDTTSKGVDS